MEIKSKNKYSFGEDFEYDALRANKNISKIISGETGRKKKVKKRR